MSRPKGGEIQKAENEGMSLCEGSFFKGQNHLATINFQGICYCLGRVKIP